MPGDLLFSSLHNYLDPASGAAISTRAVLKLLARNGWRVRVFCGTAFDGNDMTSERFDALLRNLARDRREETYDYSYRGQTRRFRLLRCSDDGIEATFLLLNDRADFSFSFLLSPELGALYERALAANSFIDCAARFAASAASFSNALAAFAVCPINAPVLS